MKGFLDHAIEPDQRSGAWHDSRLGRFTSSQISRLMLAGKREMTDEELAARPKKGTGSSTKYLEDHTVLTDGAITYIRECIAEELTHSRNEGGGYATAWGIDMEEQGKAYVAETLKISIDEVGFVPFSTFAGGSSDGIIPTYKDRPIFELKCPYESKNQINYFLTLAPETMKDEYPDYYWQVQANMLWAKAANISDGRRALFATYDPRMPDEYKLKHIWVEASPEDQQLILLKVKLAQEKREEILNELKQKENGKPNV